MIIKVDKNPYDDKKPLYKYTEVDLQTGLTVLVGRNGSGKTTFINFIEENIKNEVEAGKCTLFKFDNYTDGGGTSLSAALFHDNLNQLASLALASEGQRINRNIGEVIYKVGDAVRNAESGDKLVLLFDAIDSGLDVKNIVEVKDIFKLICGDCKRKEIELYIVVSANSYEFPNGEKCLNVKKGEYTEFADYDDYRKFILAK